MTLLRPASVFALTALAFGVSSAAPPETAPEPGELRGYESYVKRKVQAELHDRLGRPLRAGETLLAAYESYPDERVLLDASDLFARAGKPGLALRAMERYLRVGRSPEGRERARRSVGELRTALSTREAEIAFTSDPAGAEICLDALRSTDGVTLGSDHTLSGCKKTPFSAWIPAGSHTMTARIAGLEPRSTPLEVKAGAHGSATVTLRARVPTGWLDVFAAAPGSSVLIDGTEAGVAPLIGTRLASGAHIVTVVPPAPAGDAGGQPAATWSGSVDVRTGDTTTVYAGSAAPVRPTPPPNPPVPFTVLTLPPLLTVSVRTLELPRLIAQAPDPEIPVPGSRGSGVLVVVAVSDVASAQEPTITMPGQGGMKVLRPVELPDMAPVGDNPPEMGEPDRSGPPERTPEPIAPTAIPEPIEPVAPLPVPDPIEPTAPVPEPVEPEPVDPLPIAEPDPLPIAEPDPLPIAEPDPLPIAETDPLPIAEPVDPEPVEPEPIAAVEPVEPDPIEPDADPGPDGTGITEVVDPGPPIGWKAPTGWTTVGLGVAVLGGAIATHVLAVQAVAGANGVDPNSPTYDADVNRYADEAKTNTAAMNWLYPVSGALVAAGVGLLVWDWLMPASSDAAEFQPDVGITPMGDGFFVHTSLSF